MAVLLIPLLVSSQDGCVVKLLVLVHPSSTIWSFYADFTFINVNYLMTSQLCQRMRPTLLVNQIGVAVDSMAILSMVWPKHAITILLLATSHFCFCDIEWAWRLQHLRMKEVIRGGWKLIINDSCKVCVMMQTAIKAYSKRRNRNSSCLKLIGYYQVSSRSTAMAFYDAQNFPWGFPRKHPNAWKK